MSDLFSFAAPFLRLLPPEWAHALSLRGIAWGLGRPQRLGANIQGGEALLSIQVAGLNVANPLGLAAGFDKDARAVGGLSRLGLGFVEVGTLTPHPQAGNPKPRVFRLPDDHAVINRMGFNNRGLNAALPLIEAARHKGVPIGINIGKNRDSTDATADYVHGVRLGTPVADYLAVNISSPNTPGLRDLHGEGTLLPFLTAIVAARNNADVGRRVPLFVKISPDLSSAACESVAAAVLASGVDGLIIANTTTGRPADLRGQNRGEAGGLSGPPLFDLATRVLSDFYRLTGGKVPIIGVGGVDSAATAYAKIRAGASLVQLYTGLIYHGPRLITDILTGLAERLRQDGYDSLHQAVGSNHAINSRL